MARNALVYTGIVIQTDQQNPPFYLPNQSVGQQHLRPNSVGGEQLLDMSVSTIKLSEPTRAAAIGDIVVGSTGDVASGDAHYDNLADAMAAAVSGSKIVILKETFTENLIVDKQVTIVGMGYVSYINGDVTFDAAGDHSIIKNVRISGNILFDAGSVGCIVSECWQPTASTVTDNGDGNYYAIAED